MSPMYKLLEFAFPWYVMRWMHARYIHCKALHVYSICVTKSQSKKSTVKLLKFTTDLSRYNFSSVCLSLAWMVSTAVHVRVCVAVYRYSIHSLLQFMQFLKWLAKSSMRWQTRQRDNGMSMRQSASNREGGKLKNSKTLDMSPNKVAFFACVCVFCCCCCCLFLFCCVYSQCFSATTKKHHEQSLWKMWFVSCIIAIKSGVESFRAGEYSQYKADDTHTKKVVGVHEYAFVHINTSAANSN